MPGSEDIGWRLVDVLVPRLRDPGGFQGGLGELAWLGKGRGKPGYNHELS